MYAGAMDIYQCNLKLILGLIWTLILRYQIAGPVASEPSESGPKKVKEKKKKPQMSGKKLLIRWVSIAIPRSKVANFTTAWNDGLALSALVDYCKPGLIPDHASLNPSNGLENIKNAMDIAEKELGVPQVMHPEDMAVENPDELSVMTYVSGYCHQDSAAQTSLLVWINKQIPKQPVSNLSSDWTDGRALGALTNALSRGQFPEHEQMDAQNALENCQQALEKAQLLLEIQPLATPEEFSTGSLNQLTRISYLAQFQSLSKNLIDTLKIEGKGITGDIIQQETTFIVSANRIPKWANFTASVTTANEQRLQVQKQPEGDNAVRFGYTPQEAGDYTIIIYLNDTPLPPFHVQHIPLIYTNRCHAAGGGLTNACVDEEAEFVVNCEEGGSGKLQVSVHGPESNVVTSVKEKSQQNYTVNYTPVESGVHEITIKWDDEHIPDSPFECAAINPKKCTAKGEGLTRAKVNEPQTFTVNTEGAGNGKLSVKVQGPHGILPVEIQDLKNSTSLCTYVPTENGSHVIDIFLSDRPIVGSPFEVTVTATTDPLKCTISNLPEGDLHVHNTYGFTVDTNQPGSECNLTAVMQKESSLESCVVSGDSPRGVYNVHFTPTNVGQITIEVMCNGKSIPRSPLQFSTIDPNAAEESEPSVEKEPIQEISEFQLMDNIEESINIPDELQEEVANGDVGSNKEREDIELSIGEPLTLTIELESADMNKEITATATGRETEPLPVEVTKKSNDTITVHFDPIVPDCYTIDIKADGKNIPSSPFLVTYIYPIKTDKPTIEQEAHGVDADTAVDNLLTMKTDDDDDSTMENLKPQTTVQESESQTAVQESESQTAVLSPILEDEENRVSVQYNYNDGVKSSLTTSNTRICFSLNAEQAETSDATIAVQEEDSSSPDIPAVFSQPSNGEYAVEFTSTSEHEYTVMLKYLLRISPEQKLVLGSPFNLTF